MKERDYKVIGGEKKKKVSPGKKGNLEKPGKRTVRSKKEPHDRKRFIER